MLHSSSYPCIHPTIHKYIHTYIMATDPHTGCKPNCLPRGPNSSSSLWSLQSPCPIFKQSCSDSPRIKTSGKLQAQTSTSFSLKQNMSLCMRTHPETHAPLKPSQSPRGSEHFSPLPVPSVAHQSLGACRDKICSSVLGTSTLQLVEKLGSYLRHHSEVAGGNRGSRQGCQYYATKGGTGTYGPPS